MKKFLLILPFIFAVAMLNAQGNLPAPSHSTSNTNVNTETKTVDHKKMIEDNARFYNTHTPVNKFFHENQVPSQKFTFSSDKRQVIKGSSGAELTIEPNSFVTLNNEPVTGDVELELKEINNRSEMFLSNAQTVADNQLLVSGGEVYMNVSKNGQPLRMAGDKQVSVMIPASGRDGEGMETFYGTTSGGRMNWNRSNSSLSNMTTTSNSNGVSNVLNVSSTGWLNADKYMRNNNPTRLTVHVPAEYDTNNTAIFVVFSDQNTVTRVEQFKPGSFSSQDNILPVGSDVTIVGIAERNGQYYSTFNKTKLIKDHAQTVIFMPTELDVFKRELDLLK